MYGRTGEKQQSPVLYPILLKLPSTQAQLRRRDTFLTAPLKNTKGKNKPQRTFFCISLCGFEGRSERKGTRQAGRSFLSARRGGTATCTWYMIHDTWYMIHDTWYILLNMFNLYADVDARSMTPSRNRRSYTLRSVPSSPGRSFLNSNRERRPTSTASSVAVPNCSSGKTVLTERGSSEPVPSWGKHSHFSPSFGTVAQLQHLFKGWLKVDKSIWGSLLFLFGPGEMVEF